MHSEALRCGLLGRTLGHSYSPAIHAQLADYAYSLYEKEPEELERFLRSGDFDGLNVTIPYKKDVMPYCAELSEQAKKVGAVNTIVRRRDGTRHQRLALRTGHQETVVAEIRREQVLRVLVRRVHEIGRAHV